MPDAWDTWTDEHKAEVVATKVMGAKGERWLAWEFPDGSFVAKRYYHPTKDIALAWAVLDKIRDAYSGISIVYTLQHTWMVRLWGPEDETRHFHPAVHAEEQNVADAICHAAVLAVEREQK